MFESVGALVIVCKILIFFVKYSKSYSRHRVLLSFFLYACLSSSEVICVLVCYLMIFMFFFQIFCFYVSYFKSIFSVYVIQYVKKVLKITVQIYIHIWYTVAQKDTLSV